MTIRSFAPGALGTSRAADMFVSMRRELDDLQRQLATGKKAESFGGLGFERRSSLDVRGKMAMLSGYQTTIEAGTLRLKMMSQVAERLDGMARDTRSDLLGSGFDIGGDGRGIAQNLAEQRLREALDHLNKDVNGRYMFAGRSTDVAPVETYDVIMNGDATRSGLSQLIAERTVAEVGADGLGRLKTEVIPPVLPATDYQVQLTGNGVGPTFPFGFELVSASSSSVAISNPGNAAGTPEQVTFAVSGIPAKDDTVTVVVRGKDNTTHTIQLAARNGVNPGDRGVFQIGGDAATTAANLNAALRAAIQDKATAVLKPRAANITAQEFFAGSAANPPDRVAVSDPLLTVPNIVAADTVQLDGNVSALGFEIMGATVSTTPAGTITAPYTAAVPPAAESISFVLSAKPVDGDKITLILEDAANVEHRFELTARAGPSNDPNAFRIGSDIASTVAGPNGLKETLKRLVGALNAGEATGFAASGARPTVNWYKGEDDGQPDSDRETAALRVDTSQVVATGARANEDAISTFLAQLGVLADARFQDTPADRERYANVTSLVRDNLSPAYGEPRLEELATDFGAAMTTLQSAKDRHRTASNMLQDTLDNVEQASTEETAAAMLNLQTRLQASYQTTSMLSRLSLVNFL
jgi:flagellar hook-associated protein 3 FlgL